MVRIPAWMKPFATELVERLDEGDEEFACLRNQVQALGEDVQSLRRELDTERRLRHSMTRRGLT